MNNDVYNRKGLPLTQKILLTIVGGIAAFILCGVYLINAFTWQQVYDFFGLTAPTQSQIENAVPIETDDSSNELVPYDESSEQARISFLCVGQSDCTVIRCGGKVAIIDAGDMGAASTITQYLQNNEIDKIDYLFLTHPHADHIGSASVILDSFDVGLCIMSHFSDDLTPSGYTYLNLLKKLTEKGIETRLAGDDEQFDMQNGTITVLSAGGFENLNDCSLVLRFECDGKSVLLMGDAGTSVEKWLMSNINSLNSDVLKAGHHGSKYSSSQGFVSAVSPQYAVISCGEDNQYGYPTSEVLKIMRECNACVLTTMSNTVGLSIANGEIKILVGEEYKQ